MAKHSTKTALPSGKSLPLNLVFQRIGMLVGIYVLGTITVLAQDFDHYKPLVSSGEIPEDFRTLTQIKYQKDLELQKDKPVVRATTIEKPQARSRRTGFKKESFILETNYLVDELLLSGKILFNDPISKYVQKVANEALAADTALRNTLRFYVVKSGAANAFSTRQGIVFITIGMMAQLENEAQLAFILAHEAVHYKNEHVINSWMEKSKIFSKRGTGDKYNDYENKIRSVSSYSQNLEFEADSLGAYLLSKTRYITNAPATAMDVLQFSHLPFDNKPFSAAFMETPYMSIPKPFYLDKIKEIDVASDSKSDTYGSHPNIATRRNKLIQFDYYGSTGGTEEYIVSKEEFQTVQKMARFESVRLLQLNRQYAEAIYVAQQLLHLYPGNRYLEIAVGKCLYGIAKYKSENDYGDCADSYGDSEGNFQQCLYVFNKMDSKQATVLASRYLYDLCKKYPEPFVTRLRDDLFMDMYTRFELQLSDFKIFEPAPVIVEKPVVKDTVAKDTTDASDTHSKLEQLRKEKEEAMKVVINKQTSNELHDKFYLLAFSEYLKDDAFIAYFNESIQKGKDKKSKEAYKASLEANMNAYEKRTQKKREESERKSKGVKLGIDKLVIVDPFYFSVDKRRKLKIENSEMKLVNFSADLKTTSQASGLESEVLAPKLFAEGDVEQFNSMALLNDWVGERMDHENKDMIPLESETMDGLADKHKTDYFAYTGVLTYKEPKRYVGAAVLIALVIYPAIPFVIGYLATPNNYALYYTILFNVRTGDCHLNENIIIKSKDSRGTMQSLMYDLMLQIKKQ